MLSRMKIPVARAVAEVVEITIQTVVSSVFIFSVCVSALTSANCFAQVKDFKISPITLDELAIEVNGASREIAYTNKQSGVYYTETNGRHRSGWQGWRIMSHEVLEDYAVALDGIVLRKSDAVKAIAFPNRLERMYPSGVEERVTMLDSIDAIAIQLQHLPGRRIQLSPLFQDAHRREDYLIRLTDGVLLIAQKNHLVRTPAEDYPVWLGIMVSPGEHNSARLIDSAVAIDQYFSPATLQSEIIDQTSDIVLVFGDRETQTVERAKQTMRNLPELLDKRKKRMEALLNYSYVRTDNTRFDKALYWAKLSLDALIMNQRGKTRLAAGAI